MPNFQLSGRSSVHKTLMLFNVNIGVTNPCWGQRLNMLLTRIRSHERELKQYSRRAISSISCALIQHKRSRPRTQLTRTLEVEMVFHLSPLARLHQKCSIKRNIYTWQTLQAGACLFLQIIIGQPSRDDLERSITKHVCFKHTVLLHDRGIYEQSAPQTLRMRACLGTDASSADVFLLEFNNGLIVG